jgi:hypothetical protein
MEERSNLSLERLFESASDFDLVIELMSRISAYHGDRIDA